MEREQKGAGMLPKPDPRVAVIAEPQRGTTECLWCSLAPQGRIHCQMGFLIGLLAVPLFTGILWFR